LPLHKEHKFTQPREGFQKPIRPGSSRAKPPEDFHCCQAWPCVSALQPTGIGQAQQQDERFSLPLSAPANPRGRISIFHRLAVDGEARRQDSGAGNRLEDGQALGSAGKAA